MLRSQMKNKSGEVMNSGGAETGEGKATLGQVVIEISLQTGQLQRNPAVTRAEPCHDEGQVHGGRPGNSQSRSLERGAIWLVPSPQSLTDF